MSSNVAAKDSVSGSLFGGGQELWAGCWGYPWTPQSLTRSAGGPILPLLAELLQRWLCTGGQKTEYPPAITSWCHLPWGSHMSRAPQESIGLLSCALSPPWPQEPGLGEVSADLGKLWWKVRAQSCSWKTWVCHPTAASDFSVCPAPRSTMSTEDAEDLVMEFLCQQYLNCWFVCPSKPPKCPHHSLTVTSPLSAFAENRVFLSVPQTWRIFANNSSPESWNLSSPPVPVVMLGMALWITGTIQHPWERSYKPLHHLINTLTMRAVPAPSGTNSSFILKKCHCSLLAVRQKDVSFNYSIYLHIPLLLWMGREDSSCLPHTGLTGCC